MQGTSKGENGLGSCFLILFLDVLPALTEISHSTDPPPTVEEALFPLPNQYVFLKQIFFIFLLDSPLCLGDILGSPRPAWKRDPLGNFNLDGAWVRAWSGKITWGRTRSSRRATLVGHQEKLEDGANQSQLTCYHFIHLQVWNEAREAGGSPIQMENHCKWLTCKDMAFHKGSAHGAMAFLLFFGFTCKGNWNTVVRMAW